MSFQRPNLNYRIKIGCVNDEQNRGKLTHMPPVIIVCFNYLCKRKCKVIDLSYFYVGKEILARRWQNGFN